MSKVARLDHLDLLRGIAAFLVLAGHARSYVFQSYSEVVHARLPVNTFYFATGLGHQAVIVFFALSGFLVGGNALEHILNQEFSWSRYLLRRLTRLWIVIVPALFLTLLFDSIGLRLTAGIGYDGRYYEIYSSGPLSFPSLDHSLLTFFGNLAFLQSIFVPTFGSNGPMWSLANEFWYYVTLPLAVWAGLPGRAAAIRVAALCTLLLIIMGLPIWLLAYGVIWAAGAVSAWCMRREALAGFLRHFATRIGAVSLFFAALFLTKAEIGFTKAEIGDLELGIAVALTLPILATLPSPAGVYSVFARASSELSYTLYLTHFPLLTLIVLAGFAPRRLPPSTFSVGLYVALILIAIIWASVVWWCFERNTDRAYSLIAAILLANTDDRLVEEERCTMVTPSKTQAKRAKGAGAPSIT